MIFKKISCIASFFNEVTALSDFYTRVSAVAKHLSARGFEPAFILWDGNFDAGAPVFSLPDRLRYLCL